MRMLGASMCECSSAAHTQCRHAKSTQPTDNRAARPVWSNTAHAARTPRLEKAEAEHLFAQYYYFSLFDLPPHQQSAATLTTIAANI
jgi:hypothetical protein